MAETTLTDIIDVTVFQDLEPEMSVEKTAFFQSGAVVRNPILDARANAPGNLTELPFWKPLDASTEPNYSSDNIASDATPQKVTQGEQIARKAFLNEGWSATDLATELASGADPIQHVRNTVERYWVQQWQRRLIAACQGVLADNDANDSDDMLHSVAVESTGSQTAATKFSRDNFIEAAYTMGDHVDGIVAMAVHSMIMKEMVKQGDVEDVRDANGVLIERTYMGRSVIVDDTLPVVAGSTSGFKYTSILFGAGAFGYGEGAPTVPVEIDRDASKADGGGVEELWTRKTWILHPFGFQQTGTPSGDSFTRAELAAAAQWDRVVDRKAVPLAFLVTN